MRTKYIITALLCLAFASISMAQSSNNLFEKYAETDGVTSVYISKAVFRMMPNIESGGLNLMNMKGKIESLHILTTENKELIPTMRKEFAQLTKKDHEELMRVNDSNGKTTFYAQMKGDNVKSLLMLSDEGSELVVIRLLGNFTLQDIQEIISDKEEESGLISIHLLGDSKLQDIQEVMKDKEDESELIVIDLRGNSKLQDIQKIMKK